MENQALYKAKTEFTFKPSLFKKSLQKEIPPALIEFIEKSIPDLDEEDLLLLNTEASLAQLTEPNEEENGDPNTYGKIFFLDRLNNVRYVNKFLEAVNDRLPLNGTLLLCLETSAQRKVRVLKKYPAPFDHLYYIFDFLIKRVWPKLPVLKKIYFYLTKGRNRVIHETEAFGRLYSCGFRLLDFMEYENKLYCLAKKIGSPDFNMGPTYGPVISLKRYGKNNKLIHVYKLRTMHPYSEYLQQFIYERNGLREGGKLFNDPRVSTLGRFFRKYWLDELPMIINMIKGDLKLFGVRPLSQHYFHLYPTDFQEYRKKFKPGLVPPFYVDLPKTLEEIIASEKRYLEAYERNPILTDLKYLAKAFNNIVFKRVKSH